MSTLKKRVPLPRLCCLCVNRAVLTDETGHCWCEEHRYRGDFLNFGAKHKYPPINRSPYAVAQGQYFWVVNAVAARDECVRHLLSVLAMLFTDESEGVA